MTQEVARRADITTLALDAIVNAANSSLMGGGGVDGAIHRAGGPAILAECRDIVARQGSLRAGAAVITTAGNLPSSYVIHTVGPVWTGDDPVTHDALLAACYRSSLDLADGHGLRTIAFPNISTGVYRFPKDRAALVATTADRGWLAEHPAAIDRVEYVCFDDDNQRLYEAILDEGTA